MTLIDKLEDERKQWEKEPDFLPLISVYTPTYNQNILIQKRAIFSVLNQTYKNFEYLIVSDGDNYELYRELQEIAYFYNEKRMKYYSIERKGLRNWFISGTHPANHALTKIKGKWIAKIDDDDIWQPNHLEECLRFALENDYEFVSGKYLKNGEVFQGHKAKDHLRIDCSEDIILGGHSTWFYRSYLKFMKYNPNAWRKKWNRVDDTDLMERMIRAEVRIGFLEKITVEVF